MINVCFGLHDGDGNYSKFVGSAVASIFENTSSPVTIHILHDKTLTPDNRDKFSYLGGHYGQQIKFHNVDEICADELNFLHTKLADKVKSRFGIGTFYRLLIKKILGGGKAIYLDADIIVNLDIAELWRHDMKNFPVAAVPEIEATLDKMVANKFLLNAGIVAKENYFCAGVMIFNLDALDEKFFYDGIKFLADNPACESFDQDILNGFFSKNYLKLEQKFDSFVPAERLKKNLSVKKKIYHYAGRCINLNFDDEYNRLFMENFSRTPWFEVDTFGKLGAAHRNEIDRFALLTQALIKMSMNHQRAFFVSPRNLPMIKSIFNIQDDEIIIENRDANSVTELFKAMEELRGQKMFFICLKGYEYIRHALIQRGFKEYENFVDATIFMTRKQSNITHSEWNLVSAL